MIQDSGCWAAPNTMHLALGLGNNWHQMVEFLGAFGPEAEKVEAVGSEGLPLKSQLCPLSTSSEPVGPATGSILGDFLVTSRTIKTQI